MDFIGLLTWHILILLIWFKTDALVEYARLLKIKWTKYEDYDLVHAADPSLSYLKFLKEYYNCFFVRLITCPICVSVWIGLVFSPLSLLWYGWWAFSLLICLGLFFFYLLAMLVDKYA